MCCAIRRRDEWERAIKEDEFLKEFIAEYESLHGVQDAMGRRMRDVFGQGIARDQRKKIYDAVHRIETERIRSANEGLHKYKRQIDHIRLDLQAREAELHKREREREREREGGGGREKSQRAQTVESNVWGYKHVLSSSFWNEEEMLQ